MSFHTTTLLPPQRRQSSTAYNNNHNDNNNNTNNSYTASRKQQRRRQYHLVAQEIESVLQGVDRDDDDDDGNDDEDDDEHEHEGNSDNDGDGNDNEIHRRTEDRQYRPRRRGRRLSLGSLRRRGNAATASLPTTTHSNVTTSSAGSVASEGAVDPRILRHRTRRRRYRRSSSVAERAINSYSLFETDNDDDMHASSSTTQKSNNNAKNKHNKHNKNNFIIYNKVYHPQSFFTPIVMFLTVTFCILIVIRIVIALLTMAVGMILLLLLTLRLLQEFLSRPWKVLWQIHKAPVVTCCGLGAVYGLLVTRLGGIADASTAWATAFIPTTSTSTTIGGLGEENEFLLLQETQNEVEQVSYYYSQQPVQYAIWFLRYLYDVGYYLWWVATSSSIIATTIPSSSSSDTTSPLFSSTFLIRQQELFSVAWSVGEGMLYGLEIGALWLVILGDASDPSGITKWLSRQFRKAIPYYHIAKRRYRRQSRRCWRVRQHSNDDGIGETQCMICLESFLNDHRPKEYLPHCLHGFHKDCLEHWTSIKPTCPICRISIYSPLPSAEDDTSVALNTNNHRHHHHLNSNNRIAVDDGYSGLLTATRENDDDDDDDDDDLANVNETPTYSSSPTTTPTASTMATTNSANTFESSSSSSASVRLLERMASSETAVVGTSTISTRSRNSTLADRNDDNNNDDDDDDDDDPGSNSNIGAVTGTTAAATSLPSSFLDARKGRKERDPS